MRGSTPPGGEGALALLGESTAKDVCVDRVGRDRIDGDAVRAELAGEGSVDPITPAFAGEYAVLENVPPR